MYAACVASPVRHIISGARSVKRRAAGYATDAVLNASIMSAGLEYGAAITCPKAIKMRLH